MGAYFLNTSRRQLLLFKPPHRRLICARFINSLSRLAGESSSVQRNSSLTNVQRAPAKRPSTTTALSTPWELHLSVTPCNGNRTFPVSSSQWKALRTKVLLRDKCTCSSCGYVSPYPHGRWMAIDHKDGNASNNETSNLRIHCPPCEAIRHCGTSGLQNRLVVGESTMEQVEIVRRTREIFENTGVIPHPSSIDPSVKPADVGVLELASMMRMTAWKDLPERYRRLKGFFSEYSSGLFQDTMLTSKPDTYVCFLQFKWTISYNNFLCREEPNDNSTEALFIKSDRKALEIAAYEHHPWINYSEELHGTGQAFLDIYPPSKTLNAQVPWIAVHSTRFKDRFPDVDGLSSAWDKMCAESRPTVAEVDELARQFNVFAGSWLVIVPSDKVDSLWRRIVESTLAGTLGNSAKVFLRDEDDPSSSHTICVYNADYGSISEVNGVREGLRRLGFKMRIGYKPDIYTYCGIFVGNPWGIPAARYRS